MSKKIAQEIFEEIRKKNEKSASDSIPHSDNFLRYLNISIGIEPDFAKRLVKALINSHKIFAIEIAAEDKKNDIPRIEGYVECDLKTIKRLKIFFQDDLIRQYESEHYNRLSYHQLIKEIMPIINTLNNTPMGHAANKAIMMGELERLMEKNFEEYTEKWKESNLDIEINKAVAGNVSDKPKKERKQDDNEDIAENESAGVKKAAGIKNYADVVSKSKNYPLDRILKIYGIDFFLRAQIRRHQFSYLTKLVESGKLLKSSDLFLLKDLLFEVKKDINSDPQLAEFREDVHGLERSITHRLYFGHNYEAQ
ncbi:MAG: hypothetical protein V1874_09740 [Spirochaetota bacterium]